MVTASMLCAQDPVPASHANDVAPTSTMRTTNDVGPMSTTHTSDDGPMSTTRTAHTSTTMGPGADLDQPATTHTGTMGGGAALPEEGGHRSVGTVIKEAFNGAPWEPRHERTMEVPCSPRLVAVLQGLAGLHDCILC